MKGDRKGDEIYADLQSERGNVGGKLWDSKVGWRPEGGGEFPKIEDKDRVARGKEELAKEARMFIAMMQKLEERGVPSPHE